LISKSLKEITAADINALVRDQIDESDTLEFKRLLDDGSPSASVDAMREVSAFANTSGGDFVIGVDASDGIAVGVPGILINDADELIRRVEDLCGNGVDPPISGIQSRAISIGTDRCVVVFRVERSWSAPHRVTVRNHAHFYGRKSKAVFQMKASDLRAAFGQVQSIRQQVDTFRRQRIDILHSPAGPLDLAPGPTLVLHVVPFASFGGTELSLWPSEEARFAFSPLGFGGGNCAVNFEGFSILSQSRSGQVSALSQISRAGWVESVTPFPGEEPKVRPRWIGKQLPPTLRKFFDALSRHGIPAPYAVLMSLTRTRGCCLVGDGGENSNPLREEELLFPAVVAASAETDVESLINPLIDRLWNAFGLESNTRFG